MPKLDFLEDNVKYFLIILEPKDSKTVYLKYIKEEDVEKFMNLKIQDDVLVDSSVNTDENIYNTFISSPKLRKSEVEEFLYYFHEPEFIKERVIFFKLDRPFPNPSR